MVRSSRRSRIACVVAAGLLIGMLGSGAAGAMSSTPPRIVAKPSNAMVNTKIMLTGSGFAARAKLTIRECSSTGWVVVAEHPCNFDNAISVVTDARRTVHPPVQAGDLPELDTEDRAGDAANVLHRQSAAARRRHDRADRSGEGDRHVSVAAWRRGGGVIRRA